ncbi:uncharacterized protein LTR77_008411 [Saxophila tyrrhenica]|uniref:Major facilitator superfamily (MFS) profile domain-containing protein n=1 Tax=Saxophila tyrrhenica TaxID=1690608 RepID=A0AAV9P4J4_9PEZI|nr:hypothetical protein LTR77_008411 [Saxophila tyrrhenica]
MGYDEKTSDSGSSAEMAYDGMSSFPRVSASKAIDMNENVDAKISNPLSDTKMDDLMQDIELFTEEKGLLDALDLLKRGALVAQDPASADSMDVLSNEEKAALRHEAAHKWKQPTALYLTIFICSIAAAVEGWDHTGASGVDLSFPQEFGLYYGARATWILGVINACPSLGAATIGWLLSDPCNNYIGRRGTIFLSAVFCLLLPIGSALTQTWQQLLIVRLLLGVGMGLKAATVPIFAAENSPARIRGALLVSWQLFVALGMLLGYSANLAVFKVPVIAWRLQMGSAFLPAIPLLVGIYFCPESARWYMKKNRYQEAYQSLLRLRFHPLQAARDLYYIHCQLEVEASIVKNSNYFSRLTQLFTVPRVRRATLASSTVMLAQQLCGITIITFYSSYIFQSASYSARTAVIASFGLSLVKFVFTLPAIWTIDTFGRRPLLLFTLPNMAWTLLAAGLCHQFMPFSNMEARVGLAAMFIYLSAAFYSLGIGPVAYAYSAEVFPLSHREAGMGLAVATNFFWSFVIAITFPRMLVTFTPVGAFGFFAGLNCLAFILIFLLVPETKQRALEELDYVFAVPSQKHVAYQTGTVVPWWFRKRLLWRRDAQLEPLYDTDKSIVVR